MVNLYSVNMDAEYWADPEVFRPERHLDTEGLQVKKSERLMAFGLGNKIVNVFVTFNCSTAGEREMGTFVIG